MSVVARPSSLGSSFRWTIRLARRRLVVRKTTRIAIAA